MTVGMPGIMVFWSGVSQLHRLLFLDFFWPKSVRKTHAEVH
jgi:arginine deiminase